jgi:hypothetical protein
MGISASLYKTKIITSEDQFKNFRYKEGFIVYPVKSIINKELIKILQDFIYTYKEEDFIIAKEILYVGSGNNFSKVLENYNDNHGILSLNEFNKYYIGKELENSDIKNKYNICDEEGWFVDLNY